MLLQWRGCIGRLKCATDLWHMSVVCLCQVLFVLLFGGLVGVHVYQQAPVCCCWPGRRVRCGAGGFGRGGAAAGGGQRMGPRGYGARPGWQGGYGMSEWVEGMGWHGVGVRSGVEHGWHVGGRRSLPCGCFGVGVGA